jgi:hypothetical protein
MKKFLVEYYTDTFIHTYKHFDTDIEVVEFIKSLNIRDYVVLELDSLGYYVLNSIFWDIK